MNNSRSSCRLFLFTIAALFSLCAVSLAHNVEPLDTEAISFIDNAAVITAENSAPVAVFKVNNADNYFDLVESAADMFEPFGDGVGIGQTFASVALIAIPIHCDNPSHRHVKFRPRNPLPV